MTARQKIEGLTNSWYGFYLASAFFGLLARGIGFFSLLWTLLSLGAAVLFTFFLGRRLLAKSAIWRFLLLIAAVVGGLTGTLGAGKSALAFFNEWSFSLLLEGAAYGITAFMHLRSFSVLTDKSVKAYFN